MIISLIASTLLGSVPNTEIMAEKENLNKEQSSIVAIDQRVNPAGSVDLIAKENSNKAVEPVEPVKPFDPKV